MPLRLLQSYMAMLPRIQAQQALRLADVAIYPHLKRAAQKQLIESWKRAAKSIIEAGHDRYGRRVLSSGAEIRAWFVGSGGRASLVGK